MIFVNKKKIKNVFLLQMLMKNLIFKLPGLIDATWFDFLFTLVFFFT